MLRSQIQKPSPDQLSLMKQQFKREGRTKEPTLSALSTDACIPVTESNEDLSRDILRQVTIKNQLLTAQLAEYKVMVQRLQQKVSSLDQENAELKRVIEGKQYASGNVNLDYDVPKELKSTLPLHQKQHNNLNLKGEFTISLSQIRDILNRYKLDGSNQKCSKETIKRQLIEMVSERQQMESFISNIWQMKDLIQPGGEMLWELWDWLKVLGSNYRDLLGCQVKPRRGRSRSRQRRLA